MHHLPREIEYFVQKAEEADAIAATQPDQGGKLDWLRVAASWRLLAERALAERTGGELLLH